MGCLYVESARGLPEMGSGWPLYFIMKPGKFVAKAYASEPDEYMETAWKIEVYTCEQEFKDAVKKLCERGIPEDVIFIQGDRVRPRMQLVI